MKGIEMKEEGTELDDEVFHGLNTDLLRVSCFL